VKTTEQCYQPGVGFPVSCTRRARAPARRANYFLKKFGRLRENPGSPGCCKAHQSDQKSDVSI